MNPLLLASASKVSSNTINTVVKAGVGIAVVLVGYGIYQSARAVKSVKDGITGGATWLAEALQLKDSEQDKLIEAFASDESLQPKFWIETYSKSSKSLTIFGFTFSKTDRNKRAEVLRKAVAFADQIHDALDGWNNFSAVMGALKQCRTKVCASMIADAYAQKYKVDLYTNLNKELSNSQMMQVISFLAALNKVQSTNLNGAKIMSIDHLQRGQQLSQISQPILMIG